MGRAETETKDASAKVQAIRENVTAIMAELQGLPELSEELLDRLEQDLRRAEEKVKEVNLDEVLAGLQERQRKQSILIDEYQNEIMRLQKEVERVENIAKTLPDGCFKKVTLEP